MKRFYFPTQLFSGLGSLEKLSDFLTGADRVLVVSDDTLLKTAAFALAFDAAARSGAITEIFSGVRPNPELSMVYQAVEAARRLQATAVVSIGGGSVMDTAKAVAMLAAQNDPICTYAEEGAAPVFPSLKHLAVPTTCGTGSEASSVAVISRNGIKKGLWADSLFPTAAFVDPRMVAGLPSGLVAETALDALSHALESFIGLDRQGVLQSLGLEAACMIMRSLTQAVEGDMDARAVLCEAAFLAGMAMGQSGTGMVHAMSDQLGEQFHVSHGLGNAVLLPHCLAYNLEEAALQLARVCTALGLCTPDCPEPEKASLVVEAVKELCTSVGIPKTFDEYIASDAQIMSMAQGACASFISDNNPRKMEVTGIATVFRAVIPNRN